MYFDISKHVGRVEPPPGCDIRWDRVKTELSLMRSVRRTECKLSESDGGG
jgi:hypothetical protein